MERNLEEQNKKDSEFTKKMFSKPLYEDKPEPEKDPELSPEELERLEETEYLAELSNFHWVMYPFFKTIEKVCDKIFGCKRKAQQLNSEYKQKREEEQKEKNRLWEEEK